MGTPIISEILDIISKTWDIFKTISIQTSIHLRESGKTILSNFRYDNPFHLLALSLILLFISVGLICLFGASGIGLSGTQPLPIGSGEVLVGTDASDLGSIFDESLEGEGEGEGTSGDSDGDGVPDANDGDIDGDDIPNSQDHDVDGDSIPNEDDPTPCGVYVESCGAYPTLCGNGVCDNFQTPAEVTELSHSYGFCSDRYVFFNIPSYCLKGVPLDTITFADYPGLRYEHAVCGTANTQLRLNSRCIINSDRTIWYVETLITCPVDCNATYDCYFDITCTSNPNNCVQYGLQCCPGGTIWAGYCTDCHLYVCSDPSGACITGYPLPLSQLKNVPFNCMCDNDNDCIGDWGSPNCCDPGTYYEGFCHHEYQCDTPI